MRIPKAFGAEPRLRITPRGRMVLLGGPLAVVTALILVAASSSSRGAAASAPGPGAEARTVGASLSALVASGSTRSPRPSTPADRNVYSATAPGRFSPAVADVPARVYVPNNDSDSVTVIDPHSYRVIRTLPTGLDPQHVAPSWDLHHLFADNDVGNSLTEIDPATGRVTRTIPVRDPYNLYFTPDGSRAIVVAERYQSLDFRNPRTWKLIKSVPIPEAGVDHLDFSADGRYLVVSCEFSGWLYRVSVDAMKVTGRMNVGGLPVDVKLSPDGRYFYVTNQGTGGVTVIDPTAMKVVKFIRTGDGAHGLAVSRDARDLYVSNRYAGTISLISFSKMKKIATWHVGGSPDMLQVSPNGRELWTANRFDNTVSVIDTRTGETTHTIDVGSRPHGLAYFPQPGRYSIGHNGVYR